MSGDTQGLPPRPPENPRLAPHHRNDVERQLEKTRASEKAQGEHMKRFEELSKGQ